jgi:glycosyltransferase involved in cell wall biosynthesis
MVTKITPVILTFNEEPNIYRTLEALQWAKKIVVVDSLSTDQTEEICKKNERVRFYKRVFDNHKNQWNYAISETDIKTEWILSLDADYVVTKALQTELMKLVPDALTNAYYININYSIFGKQLSGSLYPPIAALFRKGKCSYIQDGHTQRLQVEGNCEYLANRIILDDRKSVERWVISQSKYAKLEAEKIYKTSLDSLSWPDKLRKMIIITPWFVPLYTLLVKRAVMAGWHGLFYCFQRAGFELILSLYLIEKNIKKISNKYDIP